MLFLSSFSTLAFRSYFSHAWLWWWFEWGGVSESDRDTGMCDCSSLKGTPPSSLKRFTFNNYLNLKIHFVRAVKILCWMGWRLRTRSTIAKQDRRRQTQRKIVFLVAATIRGRLATYFIDSSKGWAHCSEVHLIVSVSCLGSAVLRATPSLSTKLCHKEHVASIWGMKRSWTNCCFSLTCYERKQKMWK